MTPHHEPFKSLAPVTWAAVTEEDPKAFLANVFSDAQTIINSIPAPEPVKQATTGRARSQTDPPHPVADLNHAVSQQRQSAAALSLSRDLSKEWKEVKVNPRDNPLAINVYKLAAKDGKGSWFARRSVHDGLTYEKWKLGLEREFAESMKVQSGPGAGAIRGIGADKRVVHQVVDGAGKMQVFQLSAQFPGPTAPRDFVTLLLTSEFSGNAPVEEGRKRPLRSFMIVSKPCVHPECAERQGYIRGQYESIEIIREIPSDKPSITRARSSIDLSHDSPKERQAVAESMGREAVLRAAKKSAEGEGGRQRGTSVDSAPARDDAGHNDDGAEEESTTSIEWLMVTRSDPGGNVPRFLIDRGTPGGIIGDAGKFIKWVTAKASEDFASSDTEQEESKEAAKEAELEKATSPTEIAKEPTSNLVPDASVQDDTNPPTSNGLYGIISGAFGMAGSVVASRLPNGLPGMFQAPSTNGSIAEEDEDEDESNESDTSSIRSFASAVEKTDEGEAVTPPDVPQPDAMSLNSSGSGAGSLSKSTSSHHERELKKLQDRRRKMQEKINKMQERMSSKRAEDSQRDSAQLAKLREKHDKEIAKQEEKYKRELKRLEERREHDERKAEERRRKQAEKEEKGNMAMELERVKAERDVALKQIEILKGQIGELQSQNTMLVAKMGRMGGLKREDSAAWSTAGERVPQSVSN
ncbi:uncharacterized protein CTRU02_213593 [Colletotrichum truncatum]|uniref:Uncharacterized protein n=1 Tax=Colletotrichum truncatum TaxID=5467 RepID=A0ACC3YG44_COLTU|nr:uncharacterized protein CTRU02_11833 [Colletotrichum truncatum]KAF6785533.1 hypothetical protein CTRU02_11833 [Colletotrichum truncatum]